MVCGLVLKLVGNVIGVVMIEVYIVMFDWKGEVEFGVVVVCGVEGW